MQTHNEEGKINLSKHEELLAVVAKERDGDEILQLHHLLRSLDKIKDHRVIFHRNYKITHKGISNNLFWNPDKSLIEQEDKVILFFWNILIKK